MKKTLLLIYITFIFSMCNSQNEDLAFVDDYLLKWDRFARGDNNLVPELNNNKELFELKLSNLLNSRNKNAPSRIIFYTFVQIGGFITYDSNLGKSCNNLFHDTVPIFVSDKGIKMYYAGDLFIWWENNKYKYNKYPLLDEWYNRDLTKRMVIPMYISSIKNRNK